MSLEKSNLHVDIHKRHKPAFYIQKMSIIFVRWVELSLPCVYLLVFFPKLQKNKKKNKTNIVITDCVAESDDPVNG